MIFSLKTLVIILYSSLLFQKTSAIVQCPSSPSIVSSSCSTSQVKTSANLNIVGGTTQVCIHQVVYMDDVCSQSTDIYFFRAEGKYDGTNLQTIFEFKWSSSSLQMLAVDSSGTPSSLFTSISQPQPTYTTIPYFVCFDFANQVAYGGINSPSGSDSGQVSMADFASLPSIDNVMFYFCNDGTNSASCSFDNTNIFYQTTPPSNLDSFLWGVTPTLIRSYQANQNSGTLLSDSTSGLSASFGSDPPVWSKTNYGIEFDSTDQYITIPTFTISPANPLIYSSFTFETWIRFQSLPSATSYIFRRSSSSLSQDKFALKVTSGGTIFVTIAGGSASLSATTISANQWTLISASLTMKSDSRTYYMSIVMDGVSYASSSYTPLSTSLSFSSSDQVRIGGSTGVLATVYKLKIYSPGSHAFPSSSCSSNLITGSFGVYTLPYFYQCDAACEDCFGSDAQSCMACATPSFGLYNFQCVSCPAKTFLTETICADCVDNCDSCSSFTTCDTCSSGYTLNASDLCELDTSSTTDPGSGTGNNASSDDESGISESTKNTASALKAGQTAADATTQVASLAGNGDPVGVQAQLSGKIFISIQYFNITYSRDVLYILAQNAATPGEGSPNYIPNIPKATESQIAMRKVPYAFNKYRVVSSFVMNAWKKMIFIAIISAALVVAFSLEFAFKKKTCKLLPPTILPLLRSGIQNFFLTQLYSFLGDVTLFATLQYRTIQFNTKYEWIDFFVSIIFLIAVFSIPTWHYFFVTKYRKVIEADKEAILKFQQSNQGCKLFFNDFQDRFQGQQLFLLFLTARDFVFSLILTTLFDHPLPQMIILLIMNLAMVAYLIKRRPFKNIMNLVQQIFYETLFFLALMILIILIALDMNNSTNTGARDSLGKILIYESFAFTYGTLLITVIKVLLIVLEALKERRKSKPAAPQIKYASGEDTPVMLSETDNGSSPINKSETRRKLLMPAKSESDDNSVKNKEEPLTPTIDPKLDEVSFSDKKPSKNSADPADLEARGSSRNKAALTFTPPPLIHGDDANESEHSEMIDQLLEGSPDLGASGITEYKPEMMTKSFKFLKTQEQK